MELAGNSADPDRYGIIIPTDEEWMADLSYTEAGYIKDDDAKNWDVDALLKNIKEGTKEQNKQRAHAVPEDVIRHLLSKLEIPGYDEAHEVAYVITPPQ